MTMIYLNSLELERNFIETDLRAENTLFVCLSLSLNLDAMDERVIRIKDLIPSSEMMGLFDRSYYDAYRTKYVQQLQQTPFLATLATLAKYSIEDEKHVALVCSVEESQFKYLEIIADYMEAMFGFKLYNIKEYIKAQKKNKVQSNFTSDVLDSIQETIRKCKIKEPDLEKLVDFIINGSHYEAQELMKEEKKLQKKRKKKEQKKRKNNKDLLLNDLDLMSSK